MLPVAKRTRAFRGLLAVLFLAVGLPLLIGCGEDDNPVSSPKVPTVNRVLGVRILDTMGNPHVYGEFINIEIDYEIATDSAQVWAIPFVDGNYATGASFAGSPPVYRGFGTVTRFVRGNSNNVHIDSLQLQMATAFVADSLYWEYVPVDFQFVPQFMNIDSLDPGTPELIRVNEPFWVDYSFGTSEASGVRIDLVSFSNGGSIPGGTYLNSGELENRKRGTFRSGNQFPNPVHIDSVSLRMWTADRSTLLMTTGMKVDITVQ